MVELLAAASLFVLSHLLPMHPPWRSAVERRVGARAFLIGYSLVSLVIIAWLAHAFATAPYLLLWPWHPVAAWLPVLAMPLACILLVAGLTSRNPFSLGAGAQGYNPGRPGIVAVTRHPVMWALALWAGSHIPINGDLAAVVLFGLMLLLSLTGTHTIEVNRKKRLADPAQWQALHRGTRNLPGISGVDWTGIGWMRLLGGLGLFVLLLFAHKPILGIAPPLVR